jgi:hypothetical protein
MEAVLAEAWARHHAHAVRLIGGMLAFNAEADPSSWEEFVTVRRRFQRWWAENQWRVREMHGLQALLEGQGHDAPLVLPLRAVLRALRRRAHNLEHQLCPGAAVQARALVVNAVADF